MRIISLFSIALFVSFSATSIFAAEPTSPVPTKADFKELVIGDAYEVSTKLRAEWHGENKPIEGVLVKVTDEWLVLGTVTSERCQVFRSLIMNYFAFLLDDGILEDYPRVERFLLTSPLFVRQFTEYSKNYYWLPRDRTNIVK